MYTKFAIELDETIERQIREIADWMAKAQINAAELYPRQTLSERYARSEMFDFNLSSVLDGCVRKLLYDIEHKQVDVEALRQMSETYHARSRGTNYVNVSIDEDGYRELERLFNAFVKLEVLVKPVSKRGVKNLKSPLNVSLQYAYAYIQKQTS